VTDAHSAPVRPASPEDSALAGRTALISGASRGIGAAIAHRLARSGANVLLFAKSGADSPGRLPGSVDEVASQIRAAGGQALAYAGDLRSDADVEGAVAAAVTAFGALDIVVNNAAVFDTTPTAEITMRRYDLLHQVNTRGAFALTRAAVPHLVHSDHAHVLTISPPLTLAPKWLGAHPAYTVSKYSMSLMTLGLAAELETAPVAANSLWPSASVATEAIRTILGDDVGSSRSRSPRIMADAAYEILRSKPGERTGQLLTDVEVLRAAGVGDFSKYLLGGQENDLSPSWFLPEA
jgi:citronellol/citronellal dehydrogenase